MTMHRFGINLCNRCLKLRSGQVLIKNVIRPVNAANNHAISNCQMLHQQQREYTNFGHAHDHKRLRFVQGLGLLLVFFAIWVYYNDYCETLEEGRKGGQLRLLQKSKGGIPADPVKEEKAVEGGKVEK